jgi:hypothetical protein
MTMMDDGQPRVKSIRELTRRIENGARFFRVDRVNDAHWGIISRGWRGDPKGSN